jgi:hypothetical protein
MTHHPFNQAEIRLSASCCCWHPCLAPAWRLPPHDDPSQRFMALHTASQRFMALHTASQRFTALHIASRRLTPSRAVPRCSRKRMPATSPPRPPEMRVKPRRATAAVTRTAVKSTTSSTAFHRSVMRTAHDQRATSNRQRMQAVQRPADPCRSSPHSTHGRSRAKRRVASCRVMSLHVAS